MEFTREELQRIRERAASAGAVEGINVLWSQAYLNLAAAADTVDAMIARCTVYASEDVEPPTITDTVA